MVKIETLLKTLKESKEPLVGPFVEPLRPLEFTRENIFACNFAQENFRGFEYRNIRRLRKDLLKLQINKEVINSIVMCWVQLKVIQTVFKETKTLCCFLFKNCLLIENQKIYEETQDYMSESFSNLMLKLNKFTKKELPGLKGQFELLLRDIPVEKWIPLSAMPMWNDLEKERMYLAFEDISLSDDTLRLFRESVHLYLNSLNIKEIFVPSPDVVVKTSSQYYNDGGVNRKDYELPQNSFDSSFKYQKFNTKPLQTREVWLPGKSIKINNSFWMIIGRQILLNETTYPDPDPEITWSKIKDKLGRFGYFDVSGFGFQYPREFLLIIMEEISDLYPNSNIIEFKNIGKKILGSVSVEMPDGTFQYPPRGIGLGYYEDLKTIGILALIKKLEPISVYGDQALTKWDLIGKTIEILRDFQFIIKEGKYKTMRQLVKWSGIKMTQHSMERPRDLISPLLGLLKGQFHFERKFLADSLYQEHPIYRKLDKYLAFHYELIYGYEFYKTESLTNLGNGGLMYTTPMNVGWLKTWSVERLRRPGITFDQNCMIKESPFSVTYKLREAKEYSKSRRQVYRKSHKFNTYLLDYIEPRITLSKTCRPPYSRLASAIPEWADLKIMLKHGLTTGKTTCGLFGEDILNAVIKQKFCHNPFMAESTGGYTVNTMYYSPRGQSSEWIELANLLSNFDVLQSMIARRVDLGIGLKQIYDPLFSNYELDIKTNIINPRKRLYCPELVEEESTNKKVNYDDILSKVTIIRDPNIVDLQLFKAADLLPSNLQEDDLNPLTSDLVEDLEDELYTDFVYDPTLYEEDYFLEQVD